MRFSFAFAEQALSHARAKPAPWARRDSLLDYDFARNGYTRHGGQALPAEGAFSLTRNSPKWLLSADGATLSTFAPHLPARDDRGVTVHDAVTALPLNSLLLGAAAGQPGAWPQGWSLSPASALSATITAVDLVQRTLDLRLAGTPTAGTASLRFAGSTPFSASAGQNWSFSVSLARVAGTQTGLGAVQARLLFAPSQAGASEAVTLGASLSRVHVRATAPAGSLGVTPELSLPFTGSAPVDLTLRLAWPTLHPGAPTEPILTGLDPVTREADAITAPVSLASPFTMIVLARAHPHRAASAVAANLTDGVNIVNIRTRVSPNELGLTFRDNGNPTPTADGVLSLGQRFAAAAAYAPGDNALSVNGAACVLSQNGAPRPSLNELHIGWDGTWPSAWNGFIERVALLPRRAANAELQQLSNLANWP
jgi:hypothetical protein